MKTHGNSIWSEKDVKGMVLKAIEDYEASKVEYPKFEWRLNYKYF